MQAMERYRKEEALGSGTFATVYRVLRVSDAQVFAMKKVKLVSNQDGVSVTTLREVKFMQELRHDNILELFDVFVHKGALNLVLQFMETDCESLIKTRSIRFTEGMSHLDLHEHAPAPLMALTVKVISKAGCECFLKG
jgi:cyclin-dependent kinase 7